MAIRCLVGIAAIWTLCVSAYAQVSLSSEGAGPVPPGRCIDGIVHDDGGVEAAYGIWPWYPSASFVEPFGAGALSRGLATVCVCVVADMEFPVPDRELAFEVVVYDDDGPEGAPGTLIASISAVAEQIPVVLPGALYSVDVGGAAGSLPSSGVVFIGIEWSPLEEGSVFYVCADQSQPPRGGYLFAEGYTPSWTRIEETDFQRYGAMVIRAKGREPSIVEIPTLSLGGIVTLMLTLGLLGWRRVAGR